MSKLINNAIGNGLASSNVRSQAANVFFDTDSESPHMHDLL